MCFELYQSIKGAVLKTELVFDYNNMWGQKCLYFQKIL